jgi:hypothetical protein
LAAFFNFYVFFFKTLTPEFLLGWFFVPIF